MSSRSVFPLLLASVLPGAPLSVGVIPGVDPSAFRITTFISGVGPATTVAAAPGGGMLVATGFANATVRRYVDVDGNGVADGVGAPVIQLTAGGAITSLANVGPFVAVGVAGAGVQFFAPGPGPNDPYVNLGAVNIGFTPDWWHNTPGLAVRATPGQPGSYDVLFSIGSINNNSASPQVGLTGLVTSVVDADSIYKVTVSLSGNTLTAGGLTQVIRGIRNAVGMGFQAGTGDLYLADNGIDGFVNGNEPESADELNRVAAAAIGNGVVDLGFPTRYVQYRTGTLVGGAGGTQPVYAYQPLGNPLTGSEAEGAAGLAFSPAGFPAALSNGVFVSFYGRGGAVNGLDNEENPVRYYDFGTGLAYDFISNNEPGVYFPVGLAAVGNSLFLADLAQDGGAVFQITAIPEPGTLGLMLLAAFVFARSRRASSGKRSYGH